MPLECEQYLDINKQISILNQAISQARNTCGSVSTLHSNIHSEIRKLGNWLTLILKLGIGGYDLDFNLKNKIFCVDKQLKQAVRGGQKLSISV